MYTADGARANLTHFRPTKSVPRAYFHVFFLPQPESTARRHSDAPPSLSSFSLRFNSTFAALRPPPLSLSRVLSLYSYRVLRLSIRLRLFHSTFYFNCLLFLGVHLSFPVTSTLVHFLPLTLSIWLCAFRSLANNAAAALVPTRCFRWINLI